MGCTVSVIRGLSGTPRREPCGEPVAHEGRCMGHRTDGLYWSTTPDPCAGLYRFAVSFAGGDPEVTGWAKTAALAEAAARAVRGVR